MIDEHYLSELIEAYGLNKSELDSYTALCKTENEEIKKLMRDAELMKFNSMTYSATYSVQHKIAVNEDKIIAVIRSNDLPNSLGIIKTKEYVDEDALESAIYKGLIPEHIMTQISECMTVKEIPVLKISTKKGE